MKKNNRRQFIRSGGLLVASAAVLSNKLFAGTPTIQEGQSQEKEKVSAVEDLMREHGILKRIFKI